MEVEIMQIKCPHCGARLSVKVQPGMEGKRVRCPICNETAPFTSYKPVNAGAGGGAAATKPMRGGESTCYQESATMQMPSETSSGVIGRLNLNGVRTFDLHVGRNVVGRSAKESQADIRIPVGNSKRMSRNHLVIDVKNEPQKGYVYYVSLFKQKVNKTFINDMPLEYGDCLILKNKDVLKLPDCTLIFEIPDDEETRFEN